MGISTGIPLTKRIIETAIRDSKEGHAEKWLWDSRVTGLAIRIKPSGKATFVIRYRNSEARLRKLAIGAFGAFTVEAARIQAYQHLAAIKGIEKADPAAARRASRSGTTVAELCDRYLTASQNSIRASTLVADKSRIEIHVKPLLGSRKVAGIIPADIEGLISSIMTGKTAALAKRKGRGGNARGGKAVAIRTARMLAVIFKRAVRDRLVDSNPVSLVEKPTEDRYRPVFNWQAYTALGQAIRELEAAGVNQTALDAIRLLALTGARRSEVYELEWSAVDTQGRCLRLAATKTTPQDRPIGSAAISLLDARSKNSRFAFPIVRTAGAKSKEAPFAGTNKVWRRVRALAKMPNLHLHALRHFFASAVEECGYSKFILAGLLGHSLGGSTARYVSVVDRTLLEAADVVAARIWTALNESPATETAHLATPPTSS